MHTIRLRGAWEVTSTSGTVQHSRNFGRPRTLGPGERVWLVCERVPGSAGVSVNGKTVGTLPTDGAFAADITDVLRPRNVVVFEVASGEPLGDVAVEIRG